MKILNLFELSAQNRAKLAALGDVEVIDGNELGDNAKNIDVIYGWASLPNLFWHNPTSSSLFSPTLLVWIIFRWLNLRQNRFHWQT